MQLKKTNFLTKVYLAMPESQPNLKREGAADSSSWLANCLKRFPGRKVSCGAEAEEGAT